MSGTKPKLPVSVLFANTPWLAISIKKTTLCCTFAYKVSWIFIKMNINPTLLKTHTKKTAFLLMKMPHHSSLNWIDQSSSVLLDY